MPFFEVEVAEWRIVRVRYVIEAGSPEEALAKARIGDTLSEEVLHDREVHDRVTDDETLKELKERP